VIDFTPPSDVEDLRERTAAFVRDVVIPAETRDRGGHGLVDELRAELQARAREAGLFAPTVPRELGGLGLDVRGQALVLEEAGYSLLGPQALNCAAPDEGNMHLLEVVATPTQRERYLLPLAAGQTRSCFAMTEPPPGAGSDPTMLRTTATRIDGGWVINGTKWFITGAEGAAFTICMARTGEKIERDEGATMFLVDADNPGWRIDRVMDVIDRSFPGGHCRVTFEDCFVPDDAVLGKAGLGYRYAQVRLGPARLTHCMRWLGVARRALDMGLDHVAEREAFGAKLGELGMAQQKIAESVIDIETSRALIWRAAWTLDSGESGRHETSLAKAHVAEAVDRVVDRAVQLAGGIGVTTEDGVGLGRFLAEIRPFRIYDGPTEVHLAAIARRALRRRGQVA
jgi:acyl-CoA dehydrogenase